ncbi:MAG: hypothetical protein ACRD3Q_04820, partial [Terriglobales bacterium]
DKPGPGAAPAEDGIPVESEAGGYSHGGEAGYDSGYSDCNRGFIVEEPDEPAADETVTPRNW